MIVPEPSSDLDVEQWWPLFFGTTSGPPSLSQSLPFSSGPAVPGLPEPSIYSDISQKSTSSSVSTTQTEAKNDRSTSPVLESLSAMPAPSFQQWHLCFKCNVIKQLPPNRAICDQCSEPETLPKPEAFKFKRSRGHLTRNKVLRPHDTRGRFEKRTLKNIEKWLDRCEEEKGTT